MVSNTQVEMARTRALMTERERRRITGVESVESQKRYQAVTEVRNRIGDELPKDVAALRECHPELFSELREVVCSGE